MGKRKYSDIVIVLLILLSVRFIGSIISFFPSLDTGSLIVAIIFIVAFLGVYAIKKWGYIVAVCSSIVDFSFTVILGTALYSALMLSAVVAVDLIILIFAIIEYQRFKKI